VFVRVNVFDIYPEEYDNWYEENKFAYLSELEALRKVVPVKGKGLEIGVGTGRFAQPLGIRTGIDPSSRMLEVARSRGIKTYPGVGENLPFGDKEFDFILIAITMCFVENPEQVIEESRRVLKDNGNLIIGIIDKNNYSGKVYQDKKLQGHRFYKVANFYSPEEIVGLLKKHNFNKFTFYQTIFRPREELKKIEKPKKGYGKGSFVVIAAGN